MGVFSALSKGGRRNLPNLGGVNAPMSSVPSRLTGETAAAVVESETRALKSTTNNISHNIPGTGATIAKYGIVGGGTLLGGYLAHDALKQDAKDILDPITETISDVFDSVYAGLHLPSAGVLSGMSGVTGSVTSLLVVGLFAWGAFEVYSFSR
jgi:hypothetical protein